MINKFNYYINIFYLIKFDKYLYLNQKNTNNKFVYKFKNLYTK